MMRKLVSLVICLALIASFFTCFTTIASAASPSTTLAVYVQRGTGTAVLLHTYTQSEIALLTQVTQYYTGLDSMPSVVQGKGTGITLATLANNAKQYDAYSNVNFSSGGSIKLKTTDNNTRYYYYDGSGGYGTSTLYGLMSTPRYYYPNLYTYENPNNPDDINIGQIMGDTSGAITVQPMLCANSFQTRSMGDGSDKTPNQALNGVTVTQAVLDAQTMDSSNSYRFCFGLSANEESNQLATAPFITYYVYYVDFIMPVIMSPLAAV